MSDGRGKDAERRIAERIATELIQKGVLDDRKNVEIRVFSPRLGSTDIRVSFPNEEKE